VLEQKKRTELDWAYFHQYLQKIKNTQVGTFPCVSAVSVAYPHVEKKAPGGVRARGLHNTYLLSAMTVELWGQ